MYFDFYKVLWTLGYKIARGSYSSLPERQEYLGFLLPDHFEPLGMNCNMFRYQNSNIESSVVPHIEKPEQVQTGPEPIQVLKKSSIVAQNQSQFQ